MVAILACVRARDRMFAGPPPRGGGGLRARICIDIYLECVQLFISVGVLSTSLQV